MRLHEGGTGGGTERQGAATAVYTGTQGGFLLAAPSAATFAAEADEAAVGRLGEFLFAG